jgi:hypothetical protein
MLQETALILRVSKRETPDFKMELVEKYTITQVDVITVW